MATTEYAARHDPWLHVGAMPEEQRARALALIDSDPLRYGIEPSIWWVADAMIDFPVCKDAVLRTIQQKTGCKTWQEYKVRMREHLGLPRAVKSLLVSGVNRSGKSQYASCRGMQVANLSPAEVGKTCDPRECVLAMHSNRARSRQDQQPLYLQHVPPEWKDGKAKGSIGEACSKGYLPNNHIVLPNSRRLTFAYYSQNVRDALEGKIILYANPDEKFPVEFLTTLEVRCAQVGGVVICTYTPVEGWTAGVGAFMDEMRVLKTMPSYVLPMDGGPAMPWAAMGLTFEEYKELDRCEKCEPVEYPKVPACRPQDCLEWFAGKDGMPPPPANRQFGSVPRVAVSKDGKRGIIWFHPCDNPWGNPKNVLETRMSHGTEAVKRGVYAIVQKGWGRKFPTFDKGKHVCAPEAVPKRGINVLMMDPAGRNFFMLWTRRCGNKQYVYREWPGSYYIPGVGVPEAWAVPSGRDNHGKGNDGDAGEAQTSWGFGLLRYKFEIARLEGWDDWKKWAERVGAGPDDVAPIDEVDGWSDRNGTCEPMFDRMLDCRTANMGHTGVERPVTMLDDLGRIGMFWRPAAAGLIEDLVAKVNLLLESGQLIISSECRNLLWAMENWTYADGQRGACKDPIDCLGQYVRSGIVEMEMGRHNDCLADTRNAGDLTEYETLRGRQQRVQRLAQVGVVTTSRRW